MDILVREVQRARRASVGCEARRIRKAMRMRCWLTIYARGTIVYRQRAVSAYLKNQFQSHLQDAWISAPVIRPNVLSVNEVSGCSTVYG